MPIYRINNSIILFIHIPKAGGSTVETTLRSVGPEALMDFQYLAERRPAYRPSAQHFHAEMLTRLLHPGFVDHSFCIVRNPATRIRSEFHYRLFLRKRFPRRYGRWLAKEPIEFEPWLDYALEMAHQNRSAFDNHLRPQTEFLLEDTRVFKLEEGLGAVFEWLSGVTGTVISQPSRGELKHMGVPAVISGAARQKIERHYANDYAQFCYPFET